MIHSYSSIATFHQCPAKWNWTYRDKIPTGPKVSAPAMERGEEIHTSVENFFLRKSEQLHPEIHENYGQFMYALREGAYEHYPEFKWGVTWGYEPCDYSDPRAMIHGYMDLVSVPKQDEYVLPVYEWKTGGMYPKEHNQQAWMYAIAAMVHFPKSTGVDVMITYFDQNDYSKINYPRGMMVEYRPLLRSDIGRIEDTTIFPKMPSFKCRWCPFSKGNGGPCQFTG